MRSKLNFSLACLVLGIANFVFGQTAQQVLLNSYRYHDPDEKWLQAKFSGQIKSELSATMQQQFGQKTVISEVDINNAKGNFSMGITIKDDNIKVNYTGNDCELSVNNQIDLGSETIDRLKGLVDLTNCETAKSAVNYHIYLMGVPMKLILDEAEVTKMEEDKDFFGKPYYGITVDYPDNTWAFYFDKSTYALKGCEFKFKSNGFGEKIVFDDEVEIDGMKMFAKRTWYSLDGETWLVTDVIQFD